MKKMRLGTFIFNLAVPMLIGIVSAALTMESMDAYGTMAKPPLSPPAWVFPTAWTILYLVMGLASYFVMVAEADNRSKVNPLFWYAVQLFMNFMWSIIFFNWEKYLIAFFWLAIMWFAVLLCIIKFYQISRKAAFLLIPYIVWLTFAGYLNMGAFVLRNINT